MKKLLLINIYLVLATIFVTTAKANILSLDENDTGVYLGLGYSGIPNGMHMNGNDEPTTDSVLGEINGGVNFLVGYSFSKHFALQIEDNFNEDKTPFTIDPSAPGLSNKKTNNNIAINALFKTELGKGNFMKRNIAFVKGGIGSGYLNIESIKASSFPPFAGSGIDANVIDLKYAGVSFDIGTGYEFRLNTHNSIVAEYEYLYNVNYKISFNIMGQHADNNLGTFMTHENLITVKYQYKF